MELDFSFKESAILSWCAGKASFVVVVVVVVVERLHLSTRFRPFRFTLI